MYVVVTFGFIFGKSLCVCQLEITETIIVEC